MPWNKESIMDNKKEFIRELFDKKQTISSLCKKYNISEKTGHKWKNRFMEYGMLGLKDKPKAPLSNSRGANEKTILDIISLRVAHPTWGAKKIKILFSKANPNLPPPSTSSIYRILNKTGLVMQKRVKHNKTDEHNELRNRIMPKRVNDVWTIDFKGWWYSNKQKCLPLTIRDLFSRKILNITLCQDGKSQTVKEVLEAVFKTYGLPKVIRSDNGEPFASSSAPLGLNRLSSWFISIGILPDRITPKTPSQNGAHERMHKDLAQEIEKKVKGGLKETQAAIDKWVKQYNSVRPHEALDMKTPDELYEKSSRKYKKNSIIRYPKYFCTRKVGQKGEIYLNGKEHRLTRSLSGYTIGIEPTGRLNEYKVWLNKFPLFILRTDTSELLLIERSKIDIESLPMSWNNYLP